MAPHAQVVGLDLDGFLNAGGVERQSSFFAMGLHHKQQRFAELVAAFIERASVSHGAGNFLDPSHEAFVRFRFDYGVVTLAHAIMKQWLPL